MGAGSGSHSPSQDRMPGPSKRPAGKAELCGGKPAQWAGEGACVSSVRGQQADFFRLASSSGAQASRRPRPKEVGQKEVAYTSSSLSPSGGFLEQSVWQLERGRAAGDHLWEGAFGGGMGTRDLQGDRGGRLPLVLGRSASPGFRISSSGRLRAGSRVTQALAKVGC